MSLLLANKLTIETRDLREAFSSVSRCVPTRSPKPILQNVLLQGSVGGTLSLTATDLETAVKVVLPKVTLDHEVKFVLPYQRTATVLSKIKDQHIILAEDERKLTIQGSRFKYEWELDDPAEFPEMPKPPAGCGWHRLSGADLRLAVHRTIYATDAASQRYALGGTLVEFGEKSLAFVGTDGRRLARQIVPAETIDAGGLPEKSPNPVLPIKALQLITKVVPDGADTLAELTVVSDRGVFVRAGDVRIYSRIVEGRFPRYQDVFPSVPTHKVHLPAGELADTVDLAEVTTSEESQGVDFTLDKDVLTLRASAADKGSSQVEMACEYIAAPLTFTVLPKYVADAIKTVEPGHSIQLELVDEKNAVVFRLAPSDDAGRPFVYVVMPMTKNR